MFYTGREWVELNLLLGEVLLKFNSFYAMYIFFPFNLNPKEIGMQNLRKRK